MSTLLLIALGLMIALNLYATLVLRHSSLYDVRQKRLQLALIWLLAPVGAVLVLYLAREPRPRRHSSNYPADHGPDDGDLRLDNFSSDGCASDSGGDSGGDGGGGD